MSDIGRSSARPTRRYGDTAPRSFSGRDHTRRRERAVPLSVDCHSSFSIRPDAKLLLLLMLLLQLRLAIKRGRLSRKARDSLQIISRQNLTTKTSSRVVGSGAAELGEEGRGGSPRNTLKRHAVIYGVL
jgi:hypothetical protein